jgi:hypothetical protein
VQAGAESAIIAVGDIGEDRRRRQLPAGRLLAEIASELRLRLENDLIGGCPTSCVSGSGQSVSEVDFERK